MLAPNTQLTYDAHKKEVMMSPNAIRTVIYSTAGTVMYASFETLQKRETHVVETAFFGTAGAVVAQNLSCIVARIKAQFNNTTPDTYVTEFTVKQPTADLIRVIGVVTGIAIYHFIVKPDQL